MESSSISRLLDSIQSVQIMNKNMNSDASAAYRTDDTFENTIDLQQTTINKLKRELNSAKDVIFRLRRNEDKLREKYVNTNFFCN